MAPLGDMKLYQPSDPYYGSGRAFACGTNDPAKKERIKMLFDWMSSPEGAECIHGGIFGLNYVLSADGKTFEITEYGESALMDNSPVPEEYGGGLYADGMLQINQWMVAGIATDPKTGVPFASQNWPAQIKKSQTTTTKEWSARFGAENPVAYLKQTGTMDVVPFVNVNLVSDTSDITVIRTSCGPLVCDTSWKMIFAKDQAEFDQLWSTLKTDLEGFGWKELVEFDKAKYSALVAERNKAMGANQ
jgi:multiple sugar transport system substrate-binding protein/putative aldouronate transport system substrate-binding protein